MTRKIISIVLSACLLLSCLTVGMVTASAADTDDSAVAASADAETGSGQYAQSTVRGSAVLHCFNWKYSTIKANLADIAAAGYTAVQTSPVQQPKDYSSSWTDTAGQWWKMYQPLGLSIAPDNTSWLGNASDLQSLCTAADEYGIKVIVDIVANHLANNGTDGGTYSYLNSGVESDLKNSAYYHTYNIGCSYDNRFHITQYHLGMPDLNTGNSYVQQKALQLLKDCVDLGVDGFRFDAAKHIELPTDDSSFASDFWPTVINGIKSYKSDVFVYGEILDSAGTDISNYTKYMDVTDNSTGNDSRTAVTSGNAASLANSAYYMGAGDSKSVLWVESHDTYEEGSSSGVSDANIIKAWGITGARANSTSLFLARPNSTMGAASSDTTWKSTAVAEINKFKNFFDGTSEYMASSGNVAYCERGTAGVSIVNLSGAGSVSLTAHTMASGIYYDQITGNKFTVSNGTIKGTVGSTGVAVVYNPSDVVTTTSSSTTDYYLFGYINGANYACEEDAANMGTYKFSNGSLTATFTADSYVAVKEADNANWYMTDGWLGTNTTTATLYNTSITGSSSNKLYVPGGVQVNFTLVKNSDNSLTLSYTTGSTTDPVETTVAPTTVPATTVPATTVPATTVPATTVPVTTAPATTVPDDTDYYLFGFINGADYACESDAANMGSYKFTNGTLTATFDSDSYVAVKEADNADWYMTDGWLGTDVTSATLFSTSVLGESSNKLYVPGGVAVTFTLVNNGNGTLTLSYTTSGTETTVVNTTAPLTTAPATTVPVTTVPATTEPSGAIPAGMTLYLKPSTNWKADGARFAIYVFSNETGAYQWASMTAVGSTGYYSVTVPDGTWDGLIFARMNGSSTENNWNAETNFWNQTEDITAIPSGSNCYAVNENTWNYGGGTWSYYTPSENPTTAPATTVPATTVPDDTDYYLFGYIEGADYACESDADNMGAYHFVDGKLVTVFFSDSYVAVKEADNANWYMTDDWLGTEVTSATLYNTDLLGESANKLYVPGGVEVEFTLVKNADGTLTLSYTVLEEETTAAPTTVAPTTAAPTTVPSVDDDTSIYVAANSFNLKLTTVGVNKVGGEIALPAGTYTLKMQKYGTMMGYNKTVTDSSNGLTFSEQYRSSTTLIATGGVYFFQFMTDTNALVIKHTSSEVPNVYLIGDVHTVLKPVDGKTLAIGSTYLEPGTYKFKLNIGGTEYGYNRTVNDTTNGATLNTRSTYKADINLVTTGGTYTFTLNTATNGLIISYIEARDEASDDVHLTGDINLVLDDNGGEDDIATGTITLDENAYSIKVICYGTSYTLGEKIMDTGTKRLSGSYKTPLSLIANGGTYTFAFNKLTGTLTVTKV